MYVASNVTYSDGILLILGSVSVRGGSYQISIFCSELDCSNQRLIQGKECSESVQKSSVQKSTDTHKHHFCFVNFCDTLVEDDIRVINVSYCLVQALTLTL